MKILYAGEYIGGAANYLMGILKFMGAEVFHISSSQTLQTHVFKKKFDAMIFSDYPRVLASKRSQELMADQVSRGSGLMMVGGWASFSGPNGGWSGSVVERLLPVKCMHKDDRTNFPAAAWIVENHKHPMFKTVPFNNPPAICGLNRVVLKKNSTRLLSAKKIIKRGSSLRSLTLDGAGKPLLIIDSDPLRRIAAFTTDFAPHWCGGLVDWGGKHRRLRVNSDNHIEVGQLYIRFVSSFIRWLAGK